MKVLDHIGVSRDNLKGVTWHNIRFDSDGGEGTTTGLLAHRSDVYEELKRLATGEGEGPPAKLNLGVKVLDTSNLRDIPELEWLHGGDSGTRSIVLKAGPLKMLFIYPCCNGILINDAATWVPTATCEELLAKFSDFDPKYLRLFDLPAHSEIHKWKLRLLPLLPTWISSRAALLGDAAHATLSLLGQGAAMAIEEARSLGPLLPAGTRREDIPSRLPVYQDLRKPLGEFVKTESFEQIAHGFIFYRSKEIQSYLLQYEPIKGAEECYQQRFGADCLAN
ncbi:FAD/NAD(P)-binding domain-containing protein [Mycena maculata]|uniref:FAD/NAD(P)-binding domain-containing protein n=1 Tax=Mycena maculata TaxID=230809 RepID=A0AAD7J890_9AGAR|nr:FAD/NAD(P)-binding domain-containing protein [Mycena maculata]